MFINSLLNCKINIQVVSGDILQEGLSFAESIVGKPFKHRVVSKREVPDKASVNELVQGTAKFIHFVTIHSLYMYFDNSYLYISFSVRCSFQSQKEIKR